MQLAPVFEALDAWMAAENLAYQSEGLAIMHPVEIRIIGQSALFEAKLSLALAATRDVDAIADWRDDGVRRKLVDLLHAHGKELDPVAHEAWMPAETEYADLFRGKWVTARVARAEYVLISKAMKAPVKNRVLLIDYLAAGPSELFFELVDRYHVDLEAVL